MLFYNEKTNVICPNITKKSQSEGNISANHFVSIMPNGEV